MVTQTIDINLVPGISAPVANVSQYDVGREITFNLYNGTEAYTPTTGAVIVCNGTKSNGTGFASSTTWSGNVVTVTTDAQMTDMAGISRCELVITVGSVRVGTANFLMKVEQAGVNEDTEFNLAQIAYVADALNQIGDTHSVYETLSDRIDNIVAPSGDPTLTEVSDARYSALTSDTYASLTARILADDEYVDDKIGVLAGLGTTNKSNVVAAVNEVLSQVNNGLTDNIKAALLNCFQHVAWIDENAQTYYNALFSALYENTTIVLDKYSISFSDIGDTEQITATTNPVGSVVTWASSDTSIATVDSTGLVTSVGYGNAIITATVGNNVANCAVVVAATTVTSISAVYTQSGAVYTTDTLSVLIPDLTVIATLSDSSTTTVASTDYTLSGTLTEGTSVITVSYGGQTTTFNVTVTNYVDRMTYSIEDLSVANGTQYRNTYDGYAQMCINLNNYGRIASLAYGILPQRSNATGEFTTYYPIPIPSTATKISISVVPNTLLIRPSTWQYVPSQSRYVRAQNFDALGTGIGELNINSFTQYTGLHLSVEIDKEDGTAFSDADEPTEINVLFE